MAAGEACHFPWGKCGLKLINPTVSVRRICHFPWGKCGLKSFATPTLLSNFFMSLPVREVWIEISSVTQTPLATWSLPVREVWIEIKPYYHTWENLSQSLPVREVWIEIHVLTSSLRSSVVTSREGSVDWNFNLKCITIFTKAVTSREGSVDWNRLKKQPLYPESVTSREGSVDWNNYSLRKLKVFLQSLPVREVWIEIFNSASLSAPSWSSLPVREVWIEMCA